MENKRKFANFAKNHGVILEYAILFIIACFVVPNFFTVNAIFTVIKQAAVPCVAVMGMMLVLTTGGIDLSLANTVGLCSVVLGVLTVNLGMPAWIGIIAAKAILPTPGISLTQHMFFITAPLF